MNTEELGTCRASDWVPYSIIRNTYILYKAYIISVHHNVLDACRKEIVDYLGYPGELGWELERNNNNI